MKKLLLKSILLLCALITGTSSSWADNESVTFSAQGYTNQQEISSYTGTNFSIAFDKGSNSNAPKYYTNGTAIRAYGGNTFTVSSSHTITGITLSFGSGDGSNAITTNVTTYNSNGTWSGSANSVTFTIGGTTGNRRIASITVTYTPAAKTDPTITSNNGSVRVGKTLDVSTLFSSNSDGAVTYSITEGGSYASITGSTLTGVAAGSVTVQASQAETSAYNSKTATATITVTDPALSSIAITTAPTKTTYDEGDLFDKTGMVVTATFEDASTEDVTASCTWEPNGALTTTDDEVTISYTYKGVTKTATQDITVNAYSQPTEFDIALKNSLFGSSYSGTVSGITDDAPVSGKFNRVNVIYAGSGDHYFNNDQIRFYPNNKLTFEAPAGYIITKIEFTSGGTWTATISSNNGTYTSDTKTWTGAASTVLFTGSGSGQCRMTKAAITLSSTASVTVQSYGWATYIPNFNAEFAANTAYVVTAASVSTGLTLEAVTKVPAGTPLLLKGEGAKTATVIASATAPATNLLEVSDGTDLASGEYAYVLAKNGEGACFKQWTGDMSDLNGRVMLVLDEAVAARGIFELDDNEITGVNEVKTQKADGQYFNLAGQRVANPTKGLYIVNGKKVMVK